MMHIQWIGVGIDFALSTHNPDVLTIHHKCTGTWHQMHLLCAAMLLHL